MTPTKLLIGQILIVFAIVILGVWAATQWAAAMLGYQPELGAPWLRLAGMPVYRSWDLFPWWYHYEAYAPHVFDKAGSLAAASGFIGCGAAIGGSLWRARQSIRTSSSRRGGGDMAEIKLRKLPERTPVKMTVQLLPELAEALQEYAAAYQASYGKAEPVAELIPAMLASFLESDREFQKTRRPR